MPEQIENRMMVDSQWDELEYGLKRVKALRIREQRALEEAEREDDYELI